MVVKIRKGLHLDSIESGLWVLVGSHVLCLVCTAVLQQSKIFKKLYSVLLGFRSSNGRFFKIYLCVSAHVSVCLSVCLCVHTHGYT